MKLAEDVEAILDEHGRDRFTIRPSDLDYHKRPTRTEIIEEAVREWAKARNYPRLEDARDEETEMLRAFYKGDETADQVRARLSAQSSMQVWKTLTVSTILLR